MAAVEKKDELKAREHVLVPKHVKVPEEKVKEVLARFNVTLKQMPSISLKDTAIQGLDVKPGDLIEITRESQTNKTTVFYRMVKNA